METTDLSDRQQEAARFLARARQAIARVDAGTLSYPLIVVEIPHQRPVRAYSVDSRDQLTDIAWRMSERDASDDAANFRNSDSLPSEDDAIEYIGHDLAGLRVFDSTAVRARLHVSERTDVAVEVGRLAFKLGLLIESEEHAT